MIDRSVSINACLSAGARILILLTALPICTFGQIAHAGTALLPNLIITPVNPTPQDCDEVAANPSDPKLPTNAKGVEFDEIDAARAVIICRDVLKSSPDNPRMQYELGRALDAAQKYDQAMNYYRKAAAAGYAIAMFSIGDLYEKGDGVETDLSAAKTWYQKAVDGGLDVAKDVTRVEQALEQRPPHQADDARTEPQRHRMMEVSNILDRLCGNMDTI